MIRRHAWMLAIALAFAAGNAPAMTTVFFSPAQGSSVSAGSFSDTLTSAGYSFTYSLDKQFTGGTGAPTGRPPLVTWPSGLHVQAITTGQVGPASLTLRRTDQQVFDIASVTFKLLGNTVATGAQLEVTPVKNGVDGPIQFLDATGISGRSFTYDLSALPLKGYDSFTLSLFIDWALTGVTVMDSSPATVPEPATRALGLIGLLVMVASAKRRRA